MGEGLEGRELMANLGLDPTFGLGGISNTPNPPSTTTTDYYTYLDNVAIQSDGKILGIGSREIYDNGTSTYKDYVAVSRVNADGTLDGSYGSGGVFVVPSVPYGSGTLQINEIAAALQSDGKLVILGQTTGDAGGSFNINDFVVMRVLPTGALDTSFGNGGYRQIDFGSSQTVSDQHDTPTSIAIGPNGQIVVAGYTSSPTTFSEDFAVAQLTSGGALDTSFGSGGKQVIDFAKGGNKNDEARAVAVQADGKVVLVGSADVGTVTINSTTYQNTDVAVARLTAQGALDTSFGSGGLATIAYDLGFDQQDTGNAVVILDNQIVIAGTSDVSQTANTYTTIQTATLTRLSTTAAISSKFALNLVQQGAAFSTEGETLNALPDGTLLLGGTANNPNGTAYGQAFTNFYNTGGINTSFGTGGTSIINGTSASGNVAVQSDGKFVFATYGGIARTTPPAPTVVSADLIFTSAAKNARSNTIALQFNTSLNPALAGNKSTYRVRIGMRGNRFVRIRRVNYDAASNQVTLILGQRVNRRAKLFVLVSPLGIVGLDSQLLNSGQPTTIPVTAMG
jgi:uncharacterized delta-60 repeat protein